MANAHRMMMLMLDVADLVMIRSGHGGERREHRGATDQCEKTGNRLENGVHDLDLCVITVGDETKPSTVSQSPQACVTRL